MYKIKFLDQLLPNQEGTEITHVYKEQFFGDGVELTEVARLWKVLGMKKIESIEIVDGKPAKKTIAEIIEMFYPESIKKSNGEIEVISEHDKKVKIALLEKYAPVKVDEAVVNRANLFAKLEAAGQSVPKNTKTEKLEELVSKL